MYAILQHGGHQYRVAPGDRLLVNRLSAEVGAVVALEPVIFLHREEGKAGSADADGARVAATVLAHRRGTKLRIFKYKPKKRYRRTMGYRSDLTEIRVDQFLNKGEALPKPEPKAEAKPKAEHKPAAKADSKSEARADAKAESKPEAKADAKAESKADAKTEPKPEAKADPKTESKSETKAGTKPAASDDAPQSGAAAPDPEAKGE